MRKRIVHIWDVPAGGALTALAVVSAAFCLGALAGMLVASQVGGGGQDSLTAYLERYLAAAQSGAAAPPRVSSILWETLRWPVLTFLLGFTALGVVGIPLLFGVRGFLLSFAVASLVRLFGGAGCLLAMALFGISGALSVPALFVLGVQSFQAARQLAGRVWGDGKLPMPYGKTYFVRCGGCAAALCVCILLDCFVVPALVSGLAGTLLVR